MRKYIIAIDDEKSVLDIYSRSFNSFEIEGYTDHLQGIGALREAIKNKKTPDAVILDFRLNDQNTDGGKVAKIIREFYTGKIFLISGKLEKKQRIDFRESEGDYIVIAKGQDVDDLIDCIEDQMLSALEKKNLSDGIIAEMGDYILRATRNLETPDKNIVLGETAFKVLSILMQKPDTLVSESEIIDVMTSEDKEVSESYARGMIRNARSSIEETGLEIHLKKKQGWYISLKKNHLKIAS